MSGQRRGDQDRRELATLLLAAQDLLDGFWHDVARGRDTPAQRAQLQDVLVKMLLVLGEVPADLLPQLHTLMYGEEQLALPAGPSAT